MKKKTKINSKPANSTNPLLCAVNDIQLYVAGVDPFRNISNSVSLGQLCIYRESRDTDKNVNLRPDGQ